MKVVKIEGVEVPEDVHHALLKCRNYTQTVAKRKKGFVGFAVTPTRIAVVDPSGGKDEALEALEGELEEARDEIAKLKAELAEAKKAQGRGKPTK